MFIRWLFPTLHSKPVSLSLVSVVVFSADAIDFEKRKTNKWQDFCELVLGEI